LGSAHLRSRRQRTDPQTILRVALEDLLRESGWLEGNEEAIEDVLIALRRDGQPAPPEPVVSEHKNPANA
jgi:hypothetical protein